MAKKMTAMEKVEVKGNELLAHEHDPYGENYVGIYRGQTHDDITGELTGNSRTYWAMFKTAYKTRYLYLGYGATNAIKGMEEYVSRYDDMPY